MQKIISFLQELMLYLIVILYFTLMKSIHAQTKTDRIHSCSHKDLQDPQTHNTSIIYSQHHIHIN